MKRVIFMAIMALFFQCWPGSVWQVRTPELFGDGQLYVWGIGDRSLGLVKAWGWWLFYGQRDGGEIACGLVPLSDTVGDAIGVIPCRVRVQEGRNKFVGWIDFRGHTRPFCGADHTERIPRKCRLDSAR